MNWKSFAIRLGLKQLTEITKQPGVDDIKPQTAIALNTWALEHPDIGEEPFPDAGKGDNVLNEAFEIPEKSWGLVWGYQRKFSLTHKASGIEAEVINGRTAPQKVIE